VQYVLANTVQEKNYDGRFSLDNKSWANEIQIVESEEERNHFVVDSHPAVLDGFIHMIRKKENEKTPEKEKEKLPENTNKKWIDVSVSRDARIKRYEKHSFMRMPQGEYEEYTYNIFNDRITKNTMLVDLQSDSRELSYNLRLGEDETILLRTKDGDEVELKADEFKEIVNGKDSGEYIRKNESKEVMWTTIRVPQEAMRGSYDKSTLFAMPQSSDWKGYTFYVPNNFVAEDTDNEDGTIKINVPNDFRFTIVNKDKEDKLVLSAYQMFQRLNGTTSREYAQEQSRPSKQNNSNNDGWSYVTVSNAAKIAEYEERTLFRMPKGEYEWYCYYIPSGLLQWNEKNHTVRISLPEDFVVSLLNRQAEQENERKLAMGSENFIALVKDKTADDYPTYQKPSETKVDKFSATEERLTRSVPQEMKDRANWVIVRTRLNEEKGKVEKFLISPVTGKFAEADAPETWTDFDTACKYARENGGVALAYALDGKDQIACIDLDNCYDEKGMPTDIAKAVLAACGQTYTEHSVSGKGLHVFGKTAGMDLRTFSKDGDMEFYQKSHFITMTGDGVSCSELASFDAPEAKKLIESKCERRVHWKGTGAGEWKVFPV
jgi:hypothetical protein